MKHLIPYFAILLVLIYGFYNATLRKGQQIEKDEKMTEQYREHTKEHPILHVQEELGRIHTPEYAKEYIISVIDHGSMQFDFPGGEMEGGFVSPKDATMFYTSVCGGCHGDDGKGLGGSYPDLTRKPLLGIEKREAFLKNLLP